MRILIHTINFSPEPISTGKYAGEMAEWLSTRGHEVRVVTTPPHYPQWKVYEGYSSLHFTRERISADASSKTLDIFRCPVWIPRVPRGWKRVLHLMSFSAASWPVMLRQIWWKPDIVMLVAPTLFCSLQVLCVSWLSNAVSWLHTHDFELDVAFELGDFSLHGMKRLVFAVERSLLRKFDRVSTISDRMVEKLQSKGVNAERRVLFPNWVNTSLIYPLSMPSPLREELGIRPSTTVALYSGNMGKKQGLELLIEVSRKLSDRADIHFVFCGEGSCRGKIAKMAQNARNVTMLPIQPTARLNHLLNLADIHLLPQVAGAADLVMPSKLTGMMASGRPILATSRPGTQLATAVEGRGIATPPGDVNAFVAALAHLADHPSLRTKLGEAARRYAVDHLSSEQILRDFELSMLAACGQPLDTGCAPGSDSEQRDITEVVMTAAARDD
jgi:colanic acid biosynthesis glycosyl transferase WcaI